MYANDVLKTRRVKVAKLWIVAEKLALLNSSK